MSLGFEPLLSGGTPARIRGLIRRRAVARAVLALSVLIIVGAWLGHQRGDLHLGVPIFDTLLFAWLSWTALPHAARSPAFR